MLNPTQHLFDIKWRMNLRIQIHPGLEVLPIDWDGDGIKEICTKKGEIKRYNGEILVKFGKGILWAVIFLVITERR